jgi:hypothetical protein
MRAWYDVVAAAFASSGKTPPSFEDFLLRLGQLQQNSQVCSVSSIKKKKKKKQKQNPNSDTCSHPPHPTDSHHNIETVSVFRGHPILGSQGTGLFVLQSSINHSCVPNVAYDFDEECKLICATQPAFSLSPLFFSFIVPGTALKDIAEGEELVRPSLT